ncbi:MAG: GNAT family N-acetyltransferase [Deltaproteobacteria bacterium]
MTATISGYGVQLRLLSAEYLELIRGWRNHPEVARYMADQEPITAERQRIWFQEISLSDRCAYYLIFFRSAPIGVINIQSRDNRPLAESRVIEPGMYLAYDSPYRGTLLAFSPALVMNDYCFEQLNCHRVVARVKRDNRAALRFNEKLGYRPVEERDGYVHLELDAPKHRQARRQLQRFIHFKED